MGSPLSLTSDVAGDALEAFTGQPELLALVEVDQPMVQAARAFLHTGKTTVRNEQKAAAIVAAASLGWSNRKIARDLGHSQDTVRAVLRLAEQAGKVGAVKDRVLAAAAEAVHADIDLGNELAERVREGGEDAPDLGQLAAFRKAGWVGAGIIADKPAAGPASITIVNQGDGVVNVVQEYAERLRRLASADSASVVIDAVPVSSAASMPDDAGGDGLARSAERLGDPTAAPPATNGGATAEAGGGVRARGEGENGNE